MTLPRRTLRHRLAAVFSGTILATMSGCYMCKPWKHGWTPKCDHAKASIYRRMLGADAAIREHLGR